MLHNCRNIFATFPMIFYYLTITVVGTILTQSQTIKRCDTE